VNYIYEINLPELIINTIGEVGANVSEQLLELLAKHELVSRMQPKLTNDSPHKATTTGQDFVCDLPHGIFMAKSLQGHQQLVNHIERLLKFGLLNMPCFWPGATTATASTLVSAASLTQASTFALQLTPPVFMSDEARQQVIKDFKQLVKGKYAAGTPMTLPDALHEYCRFKNRKPSKDEVSRVRIVAKDLNNPYMHELSSEHFSNYENKLIRDLGGRTVEERIALIKRIYELLRSKRTYLCDNPLAYWKPSISAKVRKAKAAAGIATMERVCKVFGSPEFSHFGQAHRAFYLIVMTAVVTGMRITSICRLKASDLIETLEGTPIIDVEGMDKTLAGKRQIPIPWRLHAALKDFLRTHGKFPIADRGKDKGCSDAISKLYAKFTEQYPEFILFGMKPHGLRASFNDYLRKVNVPMDIRCALIGHENQHVNSVSYSTPMTADLVGRNVHELQEMLLMTLKFDQHTQPGQGVTG